MVQEYHSDSSYVFSWDITDGNGLDSVFAYASTDSGYSYNLISAWSGHTDTLIYTIPDTTLATGCGFKFTVVIMLGIILQNRAQCLLSLGIAYRICWSRLESMGALWYLMLEI